MPRHALVSHARNAEDVVLLRALGHVAAVRYVLLAADLDAPIPGTGTLETSGWQGSVLSVASEPGLVGRTIASLDQPSGEPLHVLWVETPYGADEVFPTLSAVSLRPWVVLVVSLPGAGPSLDAAAAEAGYLPGLFDGVSRYYAAKERDGMLAALSYPACSLDQFVSHGEADALDRSEALLGEVIHWRRLAVTTWADAVVRPSVSDLIGEVTGEAKHLEREMAAMRETLSWRVTRPLRTVRTALGRIRTRR